MQKIPLMNLSKKRSFWCFQNTAEKKDPSGCPRKPLQIRAKRSLLRQFISESEEMLHFDDSHSMYTKTPTSLPNICETEFWKPPDTSKIDEKKTSRKLASGKTIISQFMRRPRTGNKICPFMSASKSSLSFLLLESIYNSKLNKIKRLNMTQIPGFLFGNLTARRQNFTYSAHEQKFQNLTFVIKEIIVQPEIQSFKTQMVVQSGNFNCHSLEICPNLDFQFTYTYPRYLFLIYIS